MSSRARVFATWFCAGVLLPPAIYGLGTLLGHAGAGRAEEFAELIALGGCPFWLFLWLPAMSQPDNSVLFFSVVVAVLVSNGFLYLVMAQLQTKIQSLGKALRIVVLSTAFPVLMGLGYGVPLALEAVQ